MDCSLAYAIRSAGPPRKATWFTHTRIVLLSLIGGVLGLGGAFIGELQSGGGLILLPIAGAPIIEEAFKPIGVYLALTRWPFAMTNRLYVACLCALAGVVFGLIESAIYVWVYVPDHPDWFVTFRFTVPIVLHATASFTVGLGLDRRVVEWVNAGTRMPTRTRNFYIAGVLIHAIYNTVAVALALSGAFDF